MNKKNYLKNLQNLNKMTKQLISIHKICESYQIPDTFFEELRQFDLIPMEQEAGEWMLDQAVLPHVEKIMRLHFDLNINMEGIDVINALLRQVEELKAENTFLRRRLSLYE